MAYADKKNAAEHAKEFNKNTYERLNIFLKKGERERIKAHAESHGQSVNGYVVGLIRADMAENSQEITEPGDVSRA